MQDIEGSAQREDILLSLQHHVREIVIADDSVDSDDSDDDGPNIEPPQFYHPTTTGPSATPSESEEIGSIFPTSKAWRCLLDH
jgi:hypothetical protein